MESGMVECLDWEYHAEGNANIIVKNQQQSLALRIRKYAKVEETSHSNKLGSLLSLEQEQLFLKLISSTYFKNENHYLSLYTPVYLSKEFLVKLMVNIDLKRPDYRKTKTISLESQTCILMPFIGQFKPDRSFSSDLFVSVEIKPKWGFIPTSKFIKNTIKKKVCRFCLHQNYKVQKSNKTLSKYCPLDLFGGCKTGVEHAIRSLLQTPQNNLKLAVSGTVCCIDELDSQSAINYESLPKVLSEIFYKDSEPGTSNQEAKIQICEQINFKRPLYDDCMNFGAKGILNLLRKMQCLDTLDVEYIFPHYKDILEKSGFTEKDFLDYHSDLWTKFFGSEQDSCKRTTEPEIWDICQYLVSATFKDCSILITFCDLVSTKDDDLHSKSIVIVDGKSYQYEIKLIDLDPRLLQNIPYYYQQDSDIASAWNG
eukprot:TCONS_00028904-protein